MPTLKDFDEMRKRTVTQSQQPQPAQGSSLMPSGESTLGGFLGSFLGPAGSVAGSGLGAAVARLRHDLPALLKIGIFGPVGSEGVAGAMGDAALDIGGDIAKNAALNAIPGVTGAVLSKTGRGLTATGEVAGRAKGLLPTMTRMAVGPILHSMGVSEAPALAAEAASVLGPAAARKAGPLMERAGKALPSTVLQGLRNLRKPDLSRNYKFPQGQEKPYYEGAEQPVKPGELFPFQSEEIQAGRPLPTAAKAATETESEIPIVTLTPEENAAHDAMDAVYARARLGPSDSVKGNLQDALAGLKKSIFQQMNDAGEFGGDRTTGQFEEGEGGLGSIARQPTGRPNQSPGGAMADMEEGYGHGLTPDLWQELALPEQAPLTLMQRLAARSQERFGVKYR